MERRFTEILVASYGRIASLHHRAPADDPVPDRELTDFTAEAFFSIQAPSEQAARRLLEETVDAIDEMLRFQPEDPLGSDIRLCMEAEHDRYAVDEA